jgi:MFS family permease
VRRPGLAINSTTTTNSTAVAVAVAVAVAEPNPRSAMTQTLPLLLVALAVLVGVAAAVRSTWSPCGLSMLSTITPFGERAKGHRYAATATWFVVGAAVGGLALGAVAAVLAALVAGTGVGSVVVGAVAIVATSTALVSDTGLAGFRVPVHYRQVNERWLDAYRPWVYGAGFGFQIGCGLATYITTAAVYLVGILAGLSGRPIAALGVGLVFGLVRGAAVTLTWRVTAPTSLLAFHQRFAALRPWADRGVLASLVVAIAVLAVAVGPAVALVGLGAVAVTTLVLRAVWHHREVRSAVASAAVTPGGPGGEVGATGPAVTRPPAAGPDRSVAVG